MVCAVSKDPQVGYTGQSSVQRVIKAVLESENMLDIKDPRAHRGSSKYVPKRPPYKFRKILESSWNLTGELHNKRRAGTGNGAAGATGITI